MDEHQSMTTVRALAILDIKSSKFHSVKDGYNGLNKVRKWAVDRKMPSSAYRCLVICYDKDYKNA